MSAENNRLKGSVPFCLLRYGSVDNFFAPRMDCSHLENSLGIGPIGDVRFSELIAAPCECRDAICFDNGQKCFCRLSVRASLQDAFSERYGRGVAAG